MKKIFSYAGLYLRRTDYMLWVPCIILSALSILLLMGILDTDHSDILRMSNRNIFVQALSVFLGVCGAIVLSLLDYKDLAKLWKVYAPLSYGLLLLTFFIGVGAPGRPDARRWLVMPFAGVTIQPAELLRVAFILMFAYHIYKLGERINHPLHLAGLLAHLAVPVVLVQIQGDSGSALIFAVMAMCMLFGAGLSWKYIAGALVGAGVSLPIIWNFVLNPWQKQRIMEVFYAADRDIEGFFFQQHWAITSLAVGGAEGSGLFADGHIYVPEMHNDFIFSFLGASLGFVGVILTIAVMSVLWFKILRVAARANDMLGYTICMGVFAMMAFQSFANIGMNIGVLPVIGNTLPFVSYGGSSVLTSYLCIGIVLSVSMHSAKTMFGSQG
ncbi:MAG: FtsW/RodA/SpoVE family cell cycle protein [Oscillospiraceae bacterium]|nr:FtsW/RodA/SpoVE family cell cycle protein [Oscillospiraceae bacterium]